MIRMKSISIFNLLLLMLFSCGDSKTEKKVSVVEQAEQELPFAVNDPTVRMVLPLELSEISGLTYSATSKNLLAVNDEQGVIYVLNAETGVTLDEIKFGKNDDYEGIASHDGYVYITESNGNVKVIKEETKTKIIEFNDRLSRDNDIEGICYDPVSQTLLLAAKGDSETEGNNKNVKSIFTMNIENGAVRKQAYIQLDLKKEYESLIASSKEENVLEKISTSSRLRKSGPSGIAIDPKTNLIYLLSSNSKTLTVLDHNGAVASINFLDKKLHIQPEGITFDQNGNLFISNEGKGGEGMIYKFERKS